jgi:predicted MFS family arabinose efflux permease
MKNSRWRWLFLAVVVLATIAAVFIGLMKPAADVTLNDIHDVGQLRERFNQDKGTTRLLLLLSPT